MKGLFAVVPVLLLTIGFFALGAVHLPSKGEKAAAQGQETTLTAEVIDVSCYLRDGLKGEKHKMCTEACAKQNIPLVLLADNGSLYIPITSAMPGTLQNDKLVKYSESKVEVKGRIFQRNGVNGIIIESVSAPTAVK